MELIIFIAVVVVAALLWSGYVKTKKTESDDAINNWKPPKAEDKPWPFGEKIAEGKIHVKPADVAGSQNRVEAPAPSVAEVTAENKATAVAKVKKAPAKKPAVKQTAAKPVVAKKTPAKKKST
jgi:hypothetical protein